MKLFPYLIIIFTLINPLTSLRPLGLRQAFGSCGRSKNNNRTSDARLSEVAAGVDG